MYVVDLAVKSGLTYSRQVFSSRYLHYMLDLKEKSRIQWMYHRRDRRVTKIAPKVEISPIELSVKLQYLCPRKIFFRTVCADAQQTLASIRSMCNEPNRETSIEQSLWESVVAYVRWLIYSKMAYVERFFCVAMGIRDELLVEKEVYYSSMSVVPSTVLAYVSIRQALKRLDTIDELEEKIKKHSVVVILFNIWWENRLESISIFTWVT